MSSNSVETIVISSIEFNVVAKENRIFCEYDIYLESEEADHWWFYRIYINDATQPDIPYEPAL